MKNTIIKKWALPGLLCGTFGLLAATCLPGSVCADQTHNAETQAQRPNVVVIMADDLGYGDVGCYGAKPENIKTPHIDQLAARGLRFTGGYCSASTCTPTRYSFLTGTYAFRKKGTGIAGPNSPALIQPGTVTLPELLQKAGYKTAVVGKWHLGLGAPGKGPQWNGDLKPGPLEIGFDYSFLLPTTNDRVPQVYVENHRVLNLDPADPLWVGHKKPSADHPTGLTHRDTLKMDWSHGHNSTIHNGISRIGFYTGGHAARFRDEDLADKWVEKSEEWIKANKNNPFFLFFASHDIHVPRIAHERFQGQSRMGWRGDTIVQLDWCVGEITRILKEQGLEDNTLVVFCSDNGPVLNDGYKDGAVEKLGDHKPAGPYSGGKYKILEGGTRTPFITYWPGTIKPGVSEEVVCTIDMATSLANHLGVAIPDTACLDSMDVMDALLGREGAKGRSQLIEQDNGRQGTQSSLGYRAGKWKLQRKISNPPKKGQNTETPGPQYRYTLYDLNSDPAEKKNVAGQHPEVFERMKAELQKMIDDGRTRVAGTRPAQASAAKTPVAKKPKPVRKKPEKPAPTFANVAYGMDERNVLDFWKAEGEGPRPLRIHIHGGGWIGGDKDRVAQVQQHLKKGISVASINYRLTGENPLPAPVHDAARAVQFLRTKAAAWNIDKDKIVLTGGSAGACTAMWLACHDDLAKPGSDDPVERESTRVLGAAVAGGQTSIDPKQAEPWIGPKVYHGMIIKAVGEETIEDVLKNYDKHEALYKEFSPYNHLTQDDPPLYLAYGPHMELPAASPGSAIHHGMFGVKMKEKSEKVGHQKIYLSIHKHIQCEVYANQDAFIDKLLLGE